MSRSIRLRASIQKKLTYDMWLEIVTGENSRLLCDDVYVQMQMFSIPIYESKAARNKFIPFVLQQNPSFTLFT